MEGVDKEAKRAETHCFRVPLVMISVIKTICFVFGKSKYAKKVRMCCERKQNASDWLASTESASQGNTSGERGARARCKSEMQERDARARIRVHATQR